MKFYGRRKTISPLEYFRDLRKRCKNICKCCKNGTGKGQDETDEAGKPMMQKKVNTSDRHTTDGNRDTARLDRQASVAVQSTSSGHSVPLATNED